MKQRYDKCKNCKKPFKDYEGTMVVDENGSFHFDCLDGVMKYSELHKKFILEN